MGALIARVVGGWSDLHARPAELAEKLVLARLHNLRLIVLDMVVSEQMAQPVHRQIIQLPAQGMPARMRLSTIRPSALRTLSNADMKKETPENASKNHSSVRPRRTSSALTARASRCWRRK